MQSSAAPNPLGLIASPGSILRFALPSIATMVFMGLYTVADVMFVARFVSSDAMASINIACPVVNLVVGFATMLATGGNAVLAAKMGEGREAEARRDFTLVVVFGIAASIVVAVAGNVWLQPLARALGATDILLPHCAEYLSVILAFTPASMLQVLFQNGVIAAGRPGVGTAMAVSCGIVNIALDYLLLGVLGMGVAGAAWGTSAGYAIAAAIGAAYFLARMEGLRFSAPSRDLRILLRSCGNGVSEMVGQAAAAVTTFLFNAVMLGIAGEDGVAAVTVLIYSQFMVSSVFFGFSMGCAPVISYDYGAGDAARLRRLVRSCLACVGIASVAAFLAAFIGASGLVSLFAPEGSAVFAMAAEGLAVFSAAYLFAGTNIFASAAFTALGNGALSAVIAFLRTFGLVPLCLLSLPHILGILGVWVAVPVAEAVTFVVSCSLLLASRRRYGYL